MSEKDFGGPPRTRLARIVAILALIVAGIPALTGAATATDLDRLATVEQRLLTELATSDEARFLVYLTERADLSGAEALQEHTAKAAHVYRTLTETANRSQAGVTKLLRDRGATFQAFWISNVIQVTGDRALVDELAARPDVARIEADRVFRVPELKPTADPDASPNAVEWGVNNIEAPRAWSELGARGDGIVVANIDTGVRFDHAALVRQYRGNTGTGFDHNYNWFDPARICGNPSTTPCDNNNHGTHTMGTILGDDGAGNQIGVAPGARWIAAKGCESGSCSSNSLLASGQWVIAPTDLNGNNPRPDLAADIVNNSWGGGQGNTWYLDTVRAWIAAGTFPVFSQGNSGPSCGTANSPGDYAESYGVGAYDSNNALANFSSRGPSTFGEVKPNISAPGVNVRSAVANGGYAAFNGTSMAAPHVAGAIALVWSASDTMRGDIDGTRTLLDDTATDVNATTCGGTVDDNNMFGEGRLNAFAAVSAAPRGPTGTLSGRVTDAASGAAVAGATVRATGPAERSATTGPDGRYTMALAEGTYSVTASHGLYRPSTVTGVAVRVNQTTTRNFTLTRLPTGTLTGRVTDQASGSPLAGAAVSVAGPTSASTTTNADGRYTLTLPVGTYSVSASMALYHTRTVSGVTVQANTTTTRNLALLPNFGTLAGTVTRQDNGQPIANASLTLFGGPGGSYRATTDGAGRYSITRVQSGEYALHTTATRCFLSGTRPVIRDGQTTTHNIVLRCY